MRDWRNINFPFMILRARNTFILFARPIYGKALTLVTLIHDSIELKEVRMVVPSFYFWDGGWNVIKVYINLAHTLKASLYDDRVKIDNNLAENAIRQM